MESVHPNIKVLAEAIKAYRFKQPLAVTLTMKMRANGRANDNMLASATCRHFLNRLNTKSFGAAAKRYGKKLQVFAVIEQNAEGRLHYHMILERPPHMAADRFSALIRELWSRTDFGYRHLDIQEMYSGGWVDYILKSRQKDGCLLDAIDWANCTTILG